MKMNIKGLHYTIHTSQNVKEYFDYSAAMIVQFLLSLYFITSAMASNKLRKISMFGMICNLLGLFSLLAALVT